MSFKNNRPWQLHLVPRLDEMVAEDVVHIPKEEAPQEHQDAGNGERANLSHALIALGWYALSQSRFHLYFRHIEAANRRR